MILRRSPVNPILTRKDVPDVPPRLADPSGVLHPGACRLGGETRLLLRVDARTGESLLLPARSPDGFRFRVEPRIVRLEGLDTLPGTVHRVRDPRLTRLEGEVLVTVNLETDAGLRIGVARRAAPGRWDLVGTVGPGGEADGALFPEPVGGRYLMLTRPDAPGPAGGRELSGEIRLRESRDLAAWTPVGRVLEGRPRAFDERIGAGPPPVKTREGWLVLYLGVSAGAGTAGILQAGAALLALDDPTVVLARTRANLLEPREPWEVSGRAPNRVRPTGMVVEETDGDGFARPGSRVKVYYGAAGTGVGLALATVAELVGACRG